MCNKLLRPGWRAGRLAGKALPGWTDPVVKEHGGYAAATAALVLPTLQPMLRAATAAAQQTTWLLLSTMLADRPPPHWHHSPSRKTPVPAGMCWLQPRLTTPLLCWSNNTRQTLPTAPGAAGGCGQRECPALAPLQQLWAICAAPQQAQVLPLQRCAAAHATPATACQRGAVPGCTATCRA
jgi:hypothetical protein